MTTEDMAAKLAETEARSKSNTKRLDKVESRQDEMDKIVTAVEVIATKLGAVDGDVKEIKDDVKALKEKPAKRWDGLVDKLIFALAGAVIAWVAAGAPGA